MTLGKIPMAQVWLCIYLLWGYNEIYQMAGSGIYSLVRDGNHWTNEKSVLMIIDQSETRNDAIYHSVNITGRQSSGQSY